MGYNKKEAEDAYWKRKEIDKKWDKFVDNVELGQIVVLLFVSICMMIAKNFL